MAGYTIKVLPKGYGGEIELMVGIKKDGSVVVDGKNCKNIKSILSKEKVLLYK